MAANHTLVRPRGFCAIFLRMTNDDRATIYGKAMLELKECQRDIAALKTYFSEYAERLKRASSVAERFAANPTDLAPDQVNPRALRLESPFHVRLFGKGRKERICPLWPETVALLKALLRKQPRGEDESIFVNRYGRPLGAAGVRFKLKHYVEAAGRNTPSLIGKRVSPHTFRHSTAVSLVTAGVDVTVIRDWLGHASLDTTNHYARANVETKRKALEKVDPAARPGKPPRWKRNPELMAWLDSL
jgi:hypothetical protein